MTTVSSLFNSFLPQTQQPQDAFMTALNQLGAQVTSLQQQVNAAGVNARSNAQLTGAYNQLTQSLGQFQQSLTAAGTNVNPAYQQAINAMGAQLNQVLSVFNGQATAPASTTQQTDAFSSGMNQLAMQVVQLQSSVAAAGATAGQNTQLRAAHQQLTASVNAYITALRNAGAQYANTPQMATLTDLSNRLAQMQAAFYQQPAPASYPTQYPTPYPQTQYPTPYPQTQYPGYPQQPQTQYPGYPQQPGGIPPRHRRHHDGPRRDNGQQIMNIIGTVAGIAGALSGQQQQPGMWQGQYR